MISVVDDYITWPVADGRSPRHVWLAAPPLGGAVVLSSLPLALLDDVSPLLSAPLPSAAEIPNPLAPRIER